MDLRKTLFSQIVLSGGSTMFPGFGDRLLSELRKKAPKDIKIRISAPPNRLYSTWVGGSILASLATFKNMWITKADYEEHGISVLSKNAF
jgi:centractin